MHSTLITKWATTPKIYYYITKLKSSFPFCIGLALICLPILTNTKVYYLYSVTCHLSPVTCHMTTTLCSFSFYESSRRFGDVAVRGLVIARVTGSKATLMHIGGTQMGWFGLVPEAPYVVDITKNEVYHNLWGLCQQNDGGCYQLSSLVVT